MARVDERDCGHATPCWIWTGPLSGPDSKPGGGYARMSLNDRTCAAHIVMWTNEHGYIPGNRELDHLCRQRACVNPEHLELVSRSRNIKRMHAARAITCEAAA